MSEKRKLSGNGRYISWETQELLDEQVLPFYCLEKKLPMNKAKFTEVIREMALFYINKNGIPNDIKNKLPSHLREF